MHAFRPAKMKTLLVIFLPLVLLQFVLKGKAADKPGNRRLKDLK